MTTALLCLLAYLIGSVPCGYLIGKIFYGVDLRTVGSKNIGATNAYRAFGFPTAIAVFLCDVSKGIFATWMGEPDTVTALLCAACALIGNDWSVFLKFKSGRGVACGLGLFLYLCPIPSLTGFAFWGVIFAVTRIVSLASILAVGSFPILVWLFDYPAEYIYFAVFIAAIIIGKHKDNIGRLLRGEEKKISRKKQENG